MKVAVYILQGNGGARLTCPAMTEGAKAAGHIVSILRDTDYHEPDHDVAVFWGYVETCQAIMTGYLAVGKPVIYLDLAYWGRGTHYKVSVNSRHPTAYFQNWVHSDKRRKELGVNIKDFHRSGKHILLAGMGAKAAWAEKLEPVESWERDAVRKLRCFTDRVIYYRPKPSWRNAKPIEGTFFSSQDSNLKTVLNNNCHAVVAHHSNVAVEGLIMGVPAFVWCGVAEPLSSKALDLIEQPFYPSDVEQWANDVAYCQWSIPEMKDGTVWRHLAAEGLLEGRTLIGK